MIIIAGTPLDISKIIDEYPKKSIERQLLHKMNESNGKYLYDSLNQLRFELRLRKEIVNAAEELNSSDLSFASFHKSKCNLKYWYRTENGGFMLKSGEKPSEAIRDIFLNGREYATECATAMIIVYYKALINIFSDDIFDEMFPRIYLMNWHLVEPLLKEVGIIRNVYDILIGDRGYFTNPDVEPKTPEWQGENVIVLPGNIYYGHGVGIGTAQNIIDALNSNRKKNATQTAYLLDLVSRPNFKKLADIYYGFKSLPQDDSLNLRNFSTAI